MPVGEGHLPQFMQIAVHTPGIEKEGSPLSGVKEETPPIPLHQRGEAVLTEGAGKRPDSIVAENADAVFHGLLVYLWITAVSRFMELCFALDVLLLVFCRFRLYNHCSFCSKKPLLKQTFLPATEDICEANWY